MQNQLKFTNTNRSQFFATVRQRVDTYFKDNGISPHANSAMWWKAIFFLGGFFLLYGLLLSNQFNVWVMLSFAVGLGMFAAFIGFNISHDALHGAFSSKSWVNRILGASFYLVGANPYVWKITHNIVHHTYTNIPGHDEDIEIAPGLIRVDTDEPVRPWQRYQHWYAFALYSLASLSWVFRKDYIKFFKKQIGHHENQSHPKREYVKLFAAKLAYYFLFLILPYLVLELSWWQIGIGFLVMHLVEGIVLGLVFQLAHVVEGTSFPVPSDKGAIEEAWAIHQLRTTANFAPRSAVAAFFCGGLNRQIEHHLFPKVCHIHYPALTHLVKQTAADFDLPYLENRSFFSALHSHYRLLKLLGRPA
ncbi:acyl-CoA desaturase [Siphonobacter sp. BAB-5385]|uniref:fatty acid desaturase family protein n=1 Tax=Siphonobacter sp. BAB-5385 TaxID=1864822 RepID=UPI000B9E6FD4|nr:acyl-CoA desaturase [Siphonobacter sp. BAB-5385]OZI05829.1 acyl-CoA desaturase [Siphonobacter sp. BAB-5385]